MRRGLQNTRMRLPKRAQGAMRALDFKFRQATAQQRVLPDYLIVGAARSGTTSLYRYLVQHPQVVAADKKEVHFFDGGFVPGVDNYERGPQWYRAHFPTRSSLCSGCITGEASPDYLFRPRAPGRIRELLPNVRMIALLRHPVERALSHYYQMRRRGVETLPVLEAMEYEAHQLQQLPAGKELGPRKNARSSYLARGLYKLQLDRFFALFPREQMLVLCAETFFQDMSETLVRAIEFLHVDTAYNIEKLDPRNVGTNRTAEEPGLYEFLESYFRPYNEELYTLIGEDYGW